MSFFAPATNSRLIALLAEAGRLAECGNLLAAEQAYANLSATSQRPEVAYEYGRFLLHYDRAEEGVPQFQWLWDFGGNGNDPHWQRLAALGLSHCHRELANRSAATFWLTTALEVSEEVAPHRASQSTPSEASPSGITISCETARTLSAEELGALANEALVAGDADRAEQLLLRSLWLERDAENALGVAADLGSLGIVELFRGHCAQAVRYFWSAYRIHHQMHDLRSMGDDLANMAEVARQLGRWDASTRLLARAERWFAAAGCPRRKRQASGWRHESQALGGVVRRDPSWN